MAENKLSEFLKTLQHLEKLRRTVHDTFRITVSMHDESPLEELRISHKFYITKELRESLTAAIIDEIFNLTVTFNDTAKRDDTVAELIEIIDKMEM